MLPLLLLWLNAIGVAVECVVVAVSALVLAVVVVVVDAFDAVVVLFF